MCGIKNPQWPQQDPVGAQCWQQCLWGSGTRHKARGWHLGGDLCLKTEGGFPKDLGVHAQPSSLLCTELRKCLESQSCEEQLGGLSWEKRRHRGDLLALSRLM